MSDERRRELERRVAASPLDFAAGHELVRELERTGETARARRELARMARAGDREAWRRVVRWAAPRPSLHQVGERDGFDPSRGCRVSTGARAELKNFVAATDEEILLMRRPLFDGVAIDTRTFETRWTEQSMALAGAALANGFAWSTSGQLSLRRDRVTVRRNFDGTPRRLTASGDRVVFVIEGATGGPRLVVLDASGELVWEKTLATMPQHVRIAGDRLVVFGPEPDARRLRVVDLESGAPCFEREIAPDAMLLDVDPGGVLLGVARSLQEVDLDSGSVRTHEGGRRGTRLFLQRGRIVTHLEREVVTASRADASVLSRAELPLRHLHAELVPAGEHIWYAGSTASERALEVIVFHAATGERVWEHTVDTGDGPWLLWIPLDGAMLLIAVAPGQERIHRFEPA